MWKKQQQRWNIYLALLIVFTFLLAFALGISLEYFKKEGERINDVRFRDYYDYQINPYAKQKPSVSNELGYFKGDSAYNYLSYRIINQKPVFNGDEASLQATAVADNTLEVWQNDLVSTSFILFKNPGDFPSDLKIEVKTEEFAPDYFISFVNPIKATNKVKNSSIYRGDYYAFDLISNTTSLPLMSFGFQPLVFGIRTGDHQKLGNYLYKVVVSYKQNEEERQLVIEQKVHINKQVVPQSKDFGFDAMINPTKSQQFNVPKTLALNSIAIDNKNLVWQTWDYTKYNNNQKFLNPENQQQFIDFYQKFNNFANMSYGYTPNFGINYAKFSLTNNDQASNKNLDELARLSYRDLLTNKNLVWEFDFKCLGEYIKMLKQAGFQKVYLPITPRGVFTLPFVYQSASYPMNSKAPSPRLGIKATFIDNKGNLTEEANLFLNTVFVKFLNELEEFLKTQDFTGFSCYFSFDETKPKVNDYLIDLVKAHSSLFKFHAYIGWEYKANLNHKNPDLDLYDDISFQQREYTFKNYNDGIINLAKKRQARHQVTRLYSSWYNYPAAFLGSNFAEQYWSEIFAYSLGLNGYGRYALDYLNNDVFQERTERNNKNEPGDSYLLYPDPKQYFVGSMRMLNYLEGIKAVNKLQVLSKKSFREVRNLLENVIKKVDNDVQQSEYKWNLNYFKNMKTLNRFIENNALKINDQVDVIKNYITLKSKEF